MSNIQIGNLQNEAAIKQPGLFKRLLWVFTSPGKLAEALAEKPKTLVTMLIGMLSLPVLYISRPALYEEFIRESVTAQSSMMEAYGIEMTPEMFEANVKTAKTTGLLFSPVGYLVSIFIIALIFFAIFKIFGGKGRFKAYLSVVSHAAMISVLYTLLLIPISYATGSLHQTASITSLATLVSAETTNPFLYGILANLDVFSIWQYAVMAIGFAAVSKLKKEHVYVIVAVAFVIGMFINAAGMNVVRNIL